MILKLPSSFTGSFNYVDCGARGDLSNPLLSVFENSRYIGFDPGLTMPSIKEDSSVYFPVALAKETGLVDFYQTKNLNCSSIFIPNQGFLDRFMQVGEFFEITETLTLKAVALDDYLPAQGINNVDFVELDTQGSELGILQGARNLLSSGVLGVRVEVEFSTMYHDQPLFGDVDSYLRQFGFMLFDLERYHLRRKTAPVDGLSREQIVWGQALYFKDWENDLAASTKQSLCKLAVIASFYGFHSYALEIVEYLLGNDVKLLSSKEKDQLKEICNHGAPVQSLTLIDRIFGLYKRMFGSSKSSFHGMNEKSAIDSSDNSYFWKD